MNCINLFIIYPSMLSVLILLISRCSGSPHWFSESISPLSETDDVVHNVFFQHTMHEVLWRHSYRTIQNLYQELSLFVQILLRVLFDLVILACQLDVIHHFGSSYCYNNMYLLPVDVICYSLAAICVFAFYMVQKIDTCKSTIVIVFNIILNIPYSKLGIVMCIWNDKNTIHEYLYCLCACIYRCTRLPDISVVLLCMHRCTACIYVYNVLMMYMYFVFVFWYTYNFRYMYWISGYLYY